MLPYQPHNQPTILSFTPASSSSPQIDNNSNKHHQQRHNIASPVLAVGEVFKLAKWDYNTKY
jgi:hypothetical protein